MQKRRGFTLLEMLVVLTIIAILATLALPAYREPLERVRGSQAAACLLEIAGRLERHRLREGSYAGFAPARADIPCRDSLADTYAFEAGVPGASTWGHVTTDALAWQLRARRRAATAGASAAVSTCPVLVYRHDGQRAVMASAGGALVTDRAAIQRCWE